MVSSGDIVKAAGIIVYVMDPKLMLPKFLVLKASNRPFHWTPPKGRLDPGESFIDAAYRETWEESGLKKEAIEMDPSFQETLRYKTNDRDKECVYYLGKLIDPEAKVTISHEHTDYAWVPANSIGEYCDKESLCTMITNADSHIRNRAH
ncbi:chain A of Ap4a hydrolase [Babesia ovis]|uniref:Bis(5'-nucleosyl)-tetraphosphatase [asymmetrical] n=1 Tax=Babesia ovis TaxID=5869 RepID=A0A9W5TBG6_BABOV|nr:chain A of Ap4a hydrolase [Babesia ovis]GFE54601.1 chain A of Ap4a hydrolase [Babesia ovis]